MTSMTFRKAVAAVCLLLGVVLLLVGGYYVWVAPIALGREGLVLTVTGLLLHAIFWALWP
jgi:hypothetical protein